MVHLGLIEEQEWAIRVTLIGLYGNITIKTTNC